MLKKMIELLFIIIATVSIAACATVSPKNPENQIDNMNLTEYAEISNTLTRYFAAVDNSQWETVKKMMTDPIHIDYSSFGAGDPADLKPDEILNAWKKFLPGFDAAHHQIGNIDIEVQNNTATVECYVTASHVIDDRVWTVVGSYQNSLMRLNNTWKLSEVKFLFKYQTGATDLPKEAQKRASSGD